MSQNLTQQLFNKRKSMLLTLSACLVILLAMSTQVNARKGQMLSGMSTWQPEMLLRQLEAEEVDSNDSETTSETNDSNSESNPQPAVSSNSTSTVSALVETNSTNSTNTTVSTNSTTPITNTNQTQEKTSTDETSEEGETTQTTESDSDSESGESKSETNSTSLPAAPCDEDDEDCLIAQAKNQAEQEKKNKAPSVPKNSTVEQKGPELILLEPRPRPNSISSKANQAPCGEGVKSKVHFLATPNSRNLIQWRTVHADPTATCIVRMFTGSKDNQFKTLKPRDGSGDNYKGEFPCGRQTGYESKEFRFPKDMDCDSCSLQLEWNTSVGKIHQCSDIAIENPLSTSGHNCAGLCKNGGVCSSGVCDCAKGYSGEYCTSEDDSDSGIIWYLIGFVVIAAAIAGLIYAAQKKKAETMNYRQEVLAQDDADNSGYDQQ